jgi:hypothetical protein
MEASELDQLGFLAEAPVGETVNVRLTVSPITTETSVWSKETLETSRSGTPGTGTSAGPQENNTARTARAMETLLRNDDIFFITENILKKVSEKL